MHSVKFVGGSPSDLVPGDLRARGRRPNNLPGFVADPEVAGLNGDCGEVVCDRARGHLTLPGGHNT